jgi:hypothetical protein
MIFLIQCLDESSLTAKQLVNRNSFLPLAASQADGSSSLGYSPSQLFDQKEADSNVKPESLPLEFLEVQMMDRNIIVPKVQISDASSFIMSR